MTMMDRPLFLPLKGAEFDAFADGSKAVEFRRHGRGWNERTCVVGRPIVLGRGYSGARLRGRIAAVSIETASKGRGLDTYGAGAEVIVIAIVDLVPVAPRAAPATTGNRRASAPSPADSDRGAR